MPGILRDKRIFVAGANGFLGKHVCALLEEEGSVVVANRVDLTAPPETRLPEDIDLVIHLAASVKGIGPNINFPYSFLQKNMQMILGIMELLRARPNIPVVAAGSICAYPEDAPLPFIENDFWQGKPDRNNLGYGMAKRFLAGSLECANQEWGLRYAHLICANLYGPGDHFDDQTSHVIPALIARLERSIRSGESTFAVWGSGEATRDFLYVEDAALAYVRAAENMLSGQSSITCNIGSGTEISIKRTVDILIDIMGYRGRVIYDTSRPSGQMRRRVDVARADLLLDWYSATPLREGLGRTVAWYQKYVAEKMA